MVLTILLNSILAVLTNHYRFTNPIFLFNVFLKFEEVYLLKRDTNSY